MSQSNPKSNVKANAKIEINTIIRTFKKVCMDALDKFDKDVLFLIMLKILQVKLIIFPEYLIDIVGLFLVEQAHHIENRNLKWFVNHDYAEQVKAWKDLTFGYGTGIADSMVDTVHRSLTRLSRDTPQELEKNAVDLLSMASKYFLLKRTVDRSM